MAEFESGVHRVSVFKLKMMSLYSGIWALFYKEVLILSKQEGAYIKNNL